MRSIHLADRVYGDIDISEPVIAELVKCPTIQRLKEIDQIGYFEPYFPGTKHTRFEHSIGVFHLLRRFGTPLEEQISGLIHDVSHSAFSHCIDYVLNVGSEAKQNHQDNVFDIFVRRSEIPNILEKHNFSLEYILNDDNFPLKEKDLPDLCADRIDYSLRTAIVFGNITKKDAEKILGSLTTKNGGWIFENFEIAKSYAELFRKLNTEYYSGLPSAVMFHTVGEYLRHALQKKFITEQDLYGTDAEVLDKTSPFHKEDDQLQLLFDRMSGKIRYWDDPRQYDAEVICKSRVIDPLCFSKNEIKRVSEIEPAWKTALKTESKPKMYHIRFER